MEPGRVINFSGTVPVIDEYGVYARMVIFYTPAAEALTLETSEGKTGDWGWWDDPAVSEPGPTCEW